jgi:hypothetical protein
MEFEMQRRGKIINENKKVIESDFSHERVIFSWYLAATKFGAQNKVVRHKLLFSNFHTFLYEL